MAIVSISRIQHRRGLQQDLPTLSSAELGWSIDQQKLYIGNGTINEGAPRLGNTEILTEYSDVLTLAKTYSYKNQDAGYSPTTGGKTSKFNSIAFNGLNLYVAVGNNGAVLTSADAVTWSPVYANTTKTLNDICFGNGLFVAVGVDGTIITSEDGITWTKSISTALINLTSVVFAGDSSPGSSINNFVATSTTGQIIISPDASAWVTTPSVVSVNLHSVAYKNNFLVAVGDEGTILTSIDSITWTVQDSPTMYNLKTVSYDYDQWIIAGEVSVVLISMDGINWGYGYTDTFRAAAKSSSNITVFVGDGGVIYKTSDINLTMCNSGTSENLYDIVYATNKFVAVGTSGTIITSTDGVTWTSVTSGTTNDLNKIVFNSTTNRFVIVGNSGTVLTSSTGFVWVSQNSGTSQNLYGIDIWNSATYIAVGANGKIITSPNSYTWTSRVSGETNDLESVTVANLGGGTFKAVVVGTSGIILTSDNTGLNWNSHLNPSNEDLHNVKYFSWTYNASSYTGYFAIGNNGTLLYSADTTAWEVLQFPTVSHLFNLYYFGNRFWVVGSIGYTSVYGDHLLDIDTLTSQSLNILYNTSTGYNGPTLYSTTYGLDYYLIAGQYDTILTSVDGQTFYSQTQRTFTLDNLNTADIYKIIPGTSKLIAVGNKGLILQSVDGEVWSGVSYVYGAGSTVRTLQNKLDDFVSIKDFGAKGDGITDDTEAINRALYEIYCRVLTPTSRKVLHFPAGRYIVSDGIRVPTNAILRGEGSGNTIIQQTADPDLLSYVMITADSKQQIESQIGYNGADLPSDIVIEDMSLESPGDGIWLTNASRLSLQRLKIIGNQNLPTSTGSYYTGIYVLGSSLATPTDINIIDCYITQFNIGIYQPDTEYSRNIILNSTTFINLYTGILMNKNDGMINTMTVSNCVFDLIGFKAIDTNHATNITSTFNSYRDVCNNYLGIGNAVNYIIDYGSQSLGCASINDEFDRTESEALTYPWVNGNSHTGAWFGGHEFRVGLWSREGGEVHTLTPGAIGASTGLTYIINDNAFNQRIQYMIKRVGKTRSGVLQICYNPGDNSHSIDDESTENGDVGVTFSLGTTIDINGVAYLILQYSSTSGTDGDFTFAISESFVKVAW
jgi:hypothetical protein